MRYSFGQESSFLKELKPGSLPLFNRENSWLEFNRRVLDQAKNHCLPLFERLNFLAIFTSNLDEFFMKRVGGLRRRLKTAPGNLSLDGRTPEEQLQQIRKVAVPLMGEADRLYLEQLLPALAKEGIYLLHWNDLNPEEKEYLKAYFHEQIFPVITPLAVDSGHPFPFISNLSTSIGVAVTQKDLEEQLFVRLKVSSLLPEWLLLPGDNSISGYRYVPLIEVVREHISEFFPGMKVISTCFFRLTRTVEMAASEEKAVDLRELIEQEVLQRRYSQGVRLEYNYDADPWIVNFLAEELNLQQDELYPRTGLLDFRYLREITSLPFPDLQFRPWQAAIPEAFSEETDIFSILKDRDVLLHHPFESFAGSIERFVEEATRDPKVLSIKMTVYRIGDETPIIPLLLKAAANGKQVICLVELKARFDEERNLQWAKMLLDAGVHVAYGIPGYKIHAKTLLVVRQESTGVKCYAHIGTGNYHHTTSGVYTDIGILTSREEFTDELLHFFNFLSGRSLKSDYKTLLVAPVNMLKRCLELIEQEKENALKGKPAQIIAKLNSLEDPEIINALYNASKAGVKIDLLVRGVCCLIPGRPGLSENIKVRSTLGRLLEHSRIHYFRQAAREPENGAFYIGSADWMRRNLRRRVEVAVPVLPAAHRTALWNILDGYLKDRVQTWELEESGSYTHCSTPCSLTGGVQENLIEEAEKCTDFLRQEN